jgi:hypothetical protein
MHQTAKAVVNTDVKKKRIGKNEGEKGVGPGGPGRPLWREMKPIRNIETVPISWTAANRPRRIAESTTGTGRFIVAPVYSRPGPGLDLFVVEDKGFQGR